EAPPRAAKSRWVQGRGNPKGDMGMRLGEVAEPMHEPFGREVRRSADGQHAGALALEQPLGAECDPVEGIAHDCEVVAARFRDEQALALAIEQLDSQRCLKGLDLLAHRALRNAELFRGASEALMPGRGVERLQIVQWRQARAHRMTSLVKLWQARETMSCKQPAGRIIG